MNAGQRTAARQQAATAPTRSGEWLLVGAEDVTSEGLGARLEARFGGCPRHQGPSSEPDLRSLLESTRPSGVILLAVSRLDADGLPDAEDASRLRELCLQTGVPRLVVVGSSEVIEPDCRHPGRVDEGWKTTVREGGAELSTAWEALELAAGRDDSSPLVRTTLVRAAPVLDPRGRGVFSRLLRRRAAVVPAGFDPALQLLDPTDLVLAVERVIDHDLDGLVHVAPAGQVPVRWALRLAGVRRIPLLDPLGAVGHRIVGWLGGRGPRSDGARIRPYLRYSFTLHGRRLAELGFRPRFDSEQALGRFVDGTAPEPSAPEPSGGGRATPSGGGRATPSGGGPRFDDFSMDRDFIDARSKDLFRFLHDTYWRIGTRGVERVPTDGPSIMVGIHRGHQPYDGVMLLHLLATRLGRYPRFLIHPSLTKPPFLADFMGKLGGILASRENADHILDAGGMLAIFPEGIQGAFASYRDAYRLRSFGRHEYVRMALRHQVPLVPFVTVGSAEIFPILAKVQWPLFQRLTLWPCLPITPTFSTVPLPSKWHTEILQPIDLASKYGPEAADDSKLVRALGEEIRALMGEHLETLVARRRHRFWGSIWNGDET